jgi:hypothetical protein
MKPNSVSIGFLALSSALKDLQAALWQGFQGKRAWLSRRFRPLLALLYGRAGLFASLSVQSRPCGVFCGLAEASSPVRLTQVDVHTQGALSIGY